MSQTDNPTTEPGTRMMFIDNLRVFLTLLVVSHHAIITYSSTGGFYYIEGREDVLTMALSGIFCGVNQAYFMSFFFMISAYFTVMSLERKGAGPFVKDRLLRIGVPILVYDALINPLIRWTLAVKFQGETRALPAYLVDFVTHFRGGVGTGPLWFLLALLLFTLAYVGLRAVNGSLPRGGQQPPRGKPGPPVPSAKKLIAFMVVFGLIAFGVRQFMRVGEEPPLINFQLAYFPLYIGLFCAGVMARRGRWFSKIPDSAGRPWLITVIISVILMPASLIAGGALEGKEDLFLGGMHWQALLYAMWEPVICVGMIAWLTVLFRRRLDGGGALQRFLSQNAYAVFIVHAPVLVFMGLALRPIMWHPLLKFVLLFSLAVPVCYALAVVLRMLPGAKRIL